MPNNSKNNLKIWSEELDNLIANLTPEVVLSDDDCCRMNERLTNLAFGADQDVVLSVLRDYRLPENIFDNYDFNKFRQELARLRLRALIRRQGIPFLFDRNNTRDQFLHQITEPLNDDTLKSVTQVLVNLLAPQDGDTETSQACRFAAIADAFLNHRLYAFQDKHRKQFLTEAAQRPNLLKALFKALIAGIGSMKLETGDDLAAALARLQALQSLIGTAKNQGSAFSEKAAFDAAVLARANEFLDFAAGTTFSELSSLLRSCENGQAALNDYLSNETQLSSLFERGVQFLQLVFAGSTAQARETLLADLDQLFTSGIATNNYETIAKLVETGLKVRPGDFTGFKAKLEQLATVEALLSPTRPNGTLRITQVARLYTQKKAYTETENVRFRECHINKILAEFKAYLDSVKFHGRWWMLKKPDGIEKIVSTEDMRTTLTAFKERLAKFNENATVISYQKSKCQDTQKHGSRALQDFMEANPLIGNKLIGFFGSWKPVCREFTCCSLPKPLDKKALIADLQKEIKAATNSEQLNSLISSINTLRAPWYRSNKSFRLEIARATRTHLLSSEVLLSVLARGISLKTIIDISNQLITSPQVTQQILEEKLLNDLRGLLHSAIPPDNAHTSQEKLAEIIKACDAGATACRPQIAQELSIQFLAFVAAGLITADNFASVKKFLGTAVSQENLASEIQHRREIFFAEKLTDPSVSRAAILEELRLLGVASQKLELEAFGETIYGAEDNVGQLAALLAAGLSFLEIQSIIAQSTITAQILPEQLRPKIKVYLEQEIGTILQIDTDAVTEDSKKATKKRFASLLSIFKNFDLKNTSELWPDASNDPVRRNAIDLIERGVSHHDLCAFNPELTLTALNSKVIENRTLADADTLLQELNNHHAAIPMGRAFLDSLEENSKNWASRRFSKYNVSEPLRLRVLSDAFAAIRFKYPRYINTEGKWIDTTPDRQHEMFSDYRRAFKAAIESALVHSYRIQTSQNPPFTLQSQSRPAETLKRKIEDLRKTSTGVIQKLVSGLGKIDETAKLAISKATEDANKALDAAKKALAEINIDTLTTVYVKDRKDLTELALEIDQNIIAADALIGLDVMRVFQEVILADIPNWQIAGISAQHITDSLATQLKNPILLYREQTRDFAKICPNWSVDNKAKLIDYLRLAIQKAEDASRDAVKQSLRAQSVIGTFSDEQAKDLLHRLFDLARLQLEIQEQINTPVDLSTLRTQLSELKTKIADLQQPYTPTVEPQTTTDSAPLLNNTYSIKFQISQSSENTHPRIQIIGVFIAGSPNPKPINYQTTDNETLVNLAFEAGKALAEARLKSVTSERQVTFWTQPRKLFELSADLSEYNPNNKKDVFHLSMLCVAVRLLEAAGYVLNPTLNSSKQFKQVFEKHGARLMAAFTRELATTTLVDDKHLARNMEEATASLTMLTPVRA